MLPDWIPDNALSYLAHTAGGLPLRAVARARGCHASTVMRHVRRVEAWREDPLIDEALEHIARTHSSESVRVAASRELSPMPSPAG
jgi:hypothetical protein